MIQFFAFLFGLIIGSFLNVVIHRVPRGESIVTPRSHCPSCNHQIPWYENVPLVSYLALRGRCRQCGIRISFRYFVVESLTGVAFALLAAVFGAGLLFAKYAVFAALMIALMVIDLDARLLPDVITFPGMAAGLAFSLIVEVNDGSMRLLARLFQYPDAPALLLSPADALLGGLFGAGLLWFLREAFWRLRHREGLGFGDVKLMALVGFFLGLKLTMLTILLGSLAGSVIGGGYMLLSGKDRKYELPFGTFLGAMALLCALWGKGIVHWYLSAF
jgi:leader peptidase (prepilin peptidase)/N-methyltransferase